MEERAERGSKYLDADVFPAILAFHCVLDDWVFGNELVEASYAIESEAYAEEIDDFI